MLLHVQLVHWETLSLRTLTSGVMKIANGLMDNVNQKVCNPHCNIGKNKSPQCIAQDIYCHLGNLALNIHHLAVTLLSYNNSIKVCFAIRRI